MNPQLHTILSIDGDDVHILTMRTRLRKTVKIEFKPPNIIITIPKGADVDVDELLARRSDLIQRKFREARSKIKILENHVILYRGQPYHVRVNHDSKPTKPRVHLTDDEIIIHVRERENPTTTLKHWMTDQTTSLVDDVVGQYSDQVNEKPTRISVTDTKRWGYCRKNKAIVYNWQLAALPPKLAEFVIVHELVHLSHLNHQRGFHVKMKRIIPEYKQRTKELKQYIALEPTFEHHMSLRDEIR